MLLTAAEVAGAETLTPPKHQNTLWYTEPATDWMTQTLPIGNGEFGATIMGDPAKDDVQFNDKTLWRGHVGGVVDNSEYGSYLSLGNVVISSDIKEYSDYRRYLDLEEAVAGVSFSCGGARYERTYIASAPDNVVAIRYTCSESGRLDLRIQLRDARPTKTTYGDGTAEFGGTVPRTGEGILPESYYCRLRVEQAGGSVTTEGDSCLRVTGADEVCLYLRGVTNYDPSDDTYIDADADLPARVEEILTAASGKGFEEVLSDHIKDYRSLADRCRLTLSESANDVPTPELIRRYNEVEPDALLEQLYFTYGRYLLISSSRGVDLPANLQGIWNNSPTPPWNSDIHSNINVEMNYWPAETTNLGDLHMKFINYVYREAMERSQWSANARQVGGQTCGWTVTTENNIYGSGSNWMANYTIANAWYCMHLWQHYLFTLDKEYLEATAFPVMKSAAEYWMERLVKADDGTYECPNEYSPEHGPASENATAHSQQLVYDLFRNTLAALRVLQTEGEDVSREDSAFREKLSEYFSKIDKGVAIEQIEGYPLLREWKYTSQTDVPTYSSHRHVSHLMAIYPGRQITLTSRPEIVEAARNSLIMRGEEGTGWSLAWKIALYARLHMPAACRRLLRQGLRLIEGDVYSGGIYENLWCAHPPFQIDGNFGTTAGIAEMLLQSHNGGLDVLPALPEEWAEGKVEGLCAEGAFTVDIVWKDSVLKTMKIVSRKGSTARVNYEGISSGYTICDKHKQKIRTVDHTEDSVTFTTAPGMTYCITRNED